MTLIVILIILTIGAILLTKYLDGYWDIQEMKEVIRETFLECDDHHRVIYKKTIIIYEVKYLSGRIKFKRKSFKH